MYLDERDGRDVIVCVVGKTTLLYDARAIDDLHAMLMARGDWVELGGADEQKPAKDGTVEAWGRDPGNPVGGWYGLKKGLRGRFGDVSPAAARGAREGRARAQPAQQPDARALGSRDGSAQRRRDDVRVDRAELRVRMRAVREHRAGRVVVPIGEMRGAPVL